MLTPSLVCEILFSLDIFQVHYWDPLYSQIRESFEFTPAPAIVKDGWKLPVFHT